MATKTNVVQIKSAKNARSTIKDVAKAAGCSVSAVSLVLNGKGNSIPQSTQQRIKQTAKWLNYKPNASARTMVTKKSNIIGLIVPDVSNQFFAELVRYIQTELNSYGYDVILCNSEDRAESDLRYINFLASRNIDGLIITPGAQSLEEKNQKKYIEALEQTGVPYLFLDRYISGYSTRVAVDNAHSSYKAIKHFIKNGHTKIGVITGPLVLNSSRNRLKGVKDALAESGLTLDDNNLFVGNYDLESGRRGAEKLFKNDITAIFAFSDVQAYGVMQRAKEEGIKIPDDLSLIGFDDIFYSSLLDVPLTTMRQPIKQLAEESCKNIVKMIDGAQKGSEEQLEHSVLVAELIERNSVKNIKQNN